MSNFTPAWFKKGFFNESLFCDDFLSTHQLLYSNGAFFTPDGRMVDPMPLRCEIFEMMREYVGANLAKKVTNVVDVLKLAAQVEDFPPVTDRIALANGTLYLDGTFQEGKPEIVRNRLPVRYDPKAAQPTHWLRFLSDLLYPEDIPTVQEFIGYCLIPSNKGQRMMVIKGSGGEGKSQIGVVLSRLFGCNMKDGSIGKISENRFARADLEHTLLCVDDDMRMEALRQTNYVKSIVTAQGQMDLERKGKQSYQGWMYARLLAFSNGDLQALYLKLTRHNGRAGAHGTYNPKHNDRSFNLSNSEHIDPERAEGNIYWDCFHGFRSALAPQDPDDLAATFSEVERQFYESRYTTFIEGQNERNAKIRHTERNRSIPDLLSSRKTCPEETIYQLGALDEHASAEDWLNIVTEFIDEFKAKFGEHVHVLDWALHLDESTPHIHERHVFDCENKYGEVAPQQEKALEALGFELPNPDKPLSRRNNRKITFDATCRKMLFEIAKRHGLELEEEAEYGNRKYLEKQDFILAKQKEQLAAQQNRLDELILKVNDMETLIDEVSAAAYDKAVEVVTDVVRTETRKEDMRMIEDTKKWVLSPERKAPQTTREYAAHRLDTVLDKFLKTMQTTAARLQEKLLKPEVRQKGKEQVKEKARDSVLQLLNRLQAEQAQNKPAAQPRTQEGHSEI